MAALDECAEGLECKAAGGANGAWAGLGGIQPTGGGVAVTPIKPVYLCYWKDSHPVSTASACSGSDCSSCVSDFYDWRCCTAGNTYCTPCGGSWCEDGYHVAFQPEWARCSSVSAGYECTSGICYAEMNGNLHCL